MSDIDPLTGLPKDLGIIESISKEKQNIIVRMVRRRYGKAMTLVEGFDNSVDIKALSKTMKAKLACGGTVKNRIIELQGDHRQGAKKVLIGAGYAESTITVS